LGIHHDEFKRIDGEWKFTPVNFEFKYYTLYEDGWVKTAMWDA